MKAELRGRRLLLRAQANPRARVRLFCLPYAGGGATIFRSWSARLPATVEVVGVELPGRGALLHAAPFVRIADVVEEAVRTLQGDDDLPFALFGHSLGAIITFEMARQLRREGRRGPEILFVSAARAPHTVVRRKQLHDLADDALIAELRHLNGTPPAVLEDRDLIRLLLPRLRADFEMLETYRYTSEPPLSCAIAAFGGREDALVRPEHLAEWRQHASSGTTVDLFDGDHFFLHSSSALFPVLGDRLTEARNGGAAHASQGEYQ
jgi:medium-chain acyl-[acyl-carrier-protein] hydrolase